MLKDMLDRPLRELIPVMQGRFTSITHYMGILTQRMPFDAWVYQEIIHETDPDFIVEVGMYMGGQTLALAHLCDARGRGHVIGIEIQPARIDPRVSAHPRITVLGKDAMEAAPEVAGLVGDKRVLVIEDSAHTYQNTLNVLTTYGALCKSGDYMVCEDTICNHGMPIDPSVDPYRAVDAFLSAHPEFYRDENRESFILTWNPGGFLRRR